MIAITSPYLVASLLVTGPQADGFVEDAHLRGTVDANGDDLARVLPLKENHVSNLENVSEEKSQMNASRC